VASAGKIIPHALGAAAVCRPGNQNSVVSSGPGADDAAGGTKPQLSEVVPPATLLPTILRFDHAFLQLPQLRHGKVVCRTLVRVTLESNQITTCGD
jgi:hypothetical protein